MIIGGRFILLLGLTSDVVELAYDRPRRIEPPRIAENE